MDWLPVAELVELLEVVLVNLVLSADNAIVVGIAVAGLPPGHRLARDGARHRRARRCYASCSPRSRCSCSRSIGLLLAGGLLLLWICWKLWRELRDGRAERRSRDQQSHPKTMLAAVWQIIVADVSMSLDNVLAVAGVAREHLWVLVVGLVLSIAFMGLAAALISRLLNRYPWIGYCRARGDLLRRPQDDLGRRARSAAVGEDGARPCVVAQKATPTSIAANPRGPSVQLRKAWHRLRSMHDVGAFEGDGEFVAGVDRAAERQARAPRRGESGEGGVERLRRPSCSGTRGRPRRLCGT